MRLTRATLLSMLFVISVIGMALVSIVALIYAYSALSAIEAGVGFAILLTVAGFLWHSRHQSSQRTNSTALNRAIVLGISLGLLWIGEISLNNFLAPPLPARDILDDIFWAVIALSILSYAFIHAYQTNSLVRGIEVGAWSGFVSGLLACGMALSVIVFGMRFITHDPLNVAEWAERGASSRAPSMAAYFAFETFAGAFGHLLVLGVAMGGLLGMAGGSLGKIVRRAAGWMRRVE